MQRTGIEYLTHTWNPVAMRCTRVSAGCDNCWHLRMATRLAGNDCFARDRQRAYRGDGPPVLLEDELLAPMRLRRPAVVGVQFMGDLFHRSVTDEMIDGVFETMADASRHTFILLTKRPDRMARWFDGVCKRRPQPGWGWCAGGPPFASSAYPFDADAGYCGTPWPLPNVILGTSIENQETADERIPLLLQVPAARRMVSIEPMLGPVDLWYAAFDGSESRPLGKLPGIDWAALGAETGPKKRRMDLDWARSVRDQCLDAGVPFFFKVDSDGNHELDGLTWTQRP